MMMKLYDDGDRGLPARPTRMATAKAAAAYAMAAIALAAIAAPALPQTAGQRGLGASVARSACGPQALGVARTVQIKTAGGPRFGQQQYPDNDILADGEVIITFDDGPSSIHTPQIVRTLEAHCTKATFFMVGSRALAEPRIVKDILRRGHTVGTHTWSHANLRAIGAVRAKDEIEMGISAVQRAAGQPIAPFFRFPYLADSRAMMAHLQSRDIANMSIDIDAYDYKTLNPAEVHKAIIAQLTAKKKGIILFHDIQSSTAHALSGLLTDLKARGFRVVHMVPDAGATTVAAYDVMATRDASRRLMAAAANPLAKRAVTWPVASVLPSTQTSGAPLPWQTAQPAAYPPIATAAPPVQPAAPPRRRIEEESWITRAFRN
jgi:peptidoglycan-N-acetylglucosamine deacetylase